MAALPADLPVRLRTVETTLAVAVIACAAGWILEPEPLFRHPAVGRYLWLPASIIGPGVLGVSVAGRVLGRGLQLGQVIFGDEPRAIPDLSLAGLLESLAIGALALYTLWWVAITLYVLFLSTSGGVLFAPLIASFVGSGLAVLVLVRYVLSWLVPPEAGTDVQPMVKE